MHVTEWWNLMMTSRSYTSRLLIGIASFACALIEYRYGRTVERQTTTVPLARISGLRVISNHALTSREIGHASAYD